MGSKYGNLQRNPKKLYGKVCWKNINNFFLQKKYKFLVCEKGRKVKAKLARGYICQIFTRVLKENGNFNIKMNPTE